MPIHANKRFLSLFHRSIHSPVIVALAAAVGWNGCAKVEPSHDFQSTRDMIAEQTGVESVFTPAEFSLINERVNALLVDGLSVDEAVRVGLLNNPAFQSLFQKIGASRADVVQSGLLSNPSLSLGVRFPEGGGRSNLSMGFAQELVDLWQIPVRKHIAEMELEQVVLTAVREGVDLVADIRSKCYGLLALQETEAITREHLKLVEQSLGISQKRFDGGETSKLDVNLVRANMLQVQIDLISIQRDRRVAEAGLARVLGLSRRGDAWGLADELPKSAPPIGDESGILILGTQQRIDSRVAMAEIGQAEGELRRQYLNIVPSVSAGVEFERPERRALPGRKILNDTARASVANGQLTAPDIQTKGERNLDRRQIIDSLLGPTVAITLPIWDQNQAQIAKAQYRVIELRTKFEGLLDQIAQEIDQAVTAYRAGLELVSFYGSEGLPQVEENVQSARSAYEAGEQSVLALIEAQENLLLQRRAYVAARKDLAVAAAELARAVGGRLSEPATSQPIANPESNEKRGMDK
ncbi:MAG: TolC family protein [Planctomycetes bacterium]|nr:TolC family protein [Planctomycetota bacterium]